jgi:hypothetical protein
MMPMPMMGGLIPMPMLHYTKTDKGVACEFVDDWCIDGDVHHLLAAYMSMMVAGMPVMMMRGGIP